VIAVDNGPLRQHVLDTGLVEHVRADGFRFRPRKRVDWVVCDMVEQPSRIAALMGEWLREGHARAALFNLKLPMKKRWQETRLCLDGLGEMLPPLRQGWVVRARQLYHDREEITVVVLPGRA
jgi:23S rRNA (cytidine2498-2'-O)-methyltransferase